MVDTGAEDSDYTEENAVAASDDGHIGAEESRAKPSKFSNLKKTMKRILLGIAIIVVGFGLFFLGGFLGAGEDIVAIETSSIKAENNNKLVYVSGEPVAQEFKDPMFNITASGLGLERVVEMYQWNKEGEQYVQKWSGQPILIEDADAKAKGYSNPQELPFSSEKWHADKVTIGSFTISPDIEKQLNTPQPLPLTMDNFLKLNPDGQKAFKLSDNSYFFGISPEKPNVGDLRVTFKTYPAATITMLAKQSGESLDIFLGKNGPIGIVRPGKVELDVIKQSVDLDESSTLKWSLRGASLLFLLVGAFVIKGRKNKSQSSEPENVDIISHNETYLEEEHEPAFSETAVQSEYSTQEQVPEEPFEASAYTEEALAPTPDNYTEDGQVPVPSYGAYSDSPSQASDISPQPEAPQPYAPPAPLDFGSPTAPDAGVTSTLQQFGIVEEAVAQQAPEAAPAEEAPSDQDSIEFTSASALEVSAPANYASNEYLEDTSEEMPFEVEIISEDDVIEESEVAPEPHAEISPPAQYIESEVPAPFVEAQALNPEPIDPVHPGYASEELPEGVEMISEDDVVDEESSDSGSELEENHFAEPYSEEALEEPLEEIPVPPASSLPPPPDYDSLFAKVAPVDAVPISDSNALPPPPDFDKLFAQVPVVEQPPVFAPEPAPISSDFDLPSIPSDFDPNAEMLAEPQYNEELPVEDDHFEGDDGHSPFGDVEDDPFAHHDEDKK